MFQSWWFHFSILYGPMELLNIEDLIVAPFHSTLLWSQVTVTFSIHMARFFRGAATKALLMCLAEFKLMAFLDGLEGEDEFMMTGSVITSTIVDLQPSNPNYPPVAAICPSHIVKTTWQLPNPKSFEPSFLNQRASPLANKNVSCWSDLPCTRRKTSYLFCTLDWGSILWFPTHSFSLWRTTVIFLATAEHKWHINDIQNCTPWIFWTTCAVECHHQGGTFINGAHQNTWHQSQGPCKGITLHSELWHKTTSLQLK